jgi:hypothetical protein
MFSECRSLFGLVLILLTRRLAFSLEVFQGVQKTLSLLARNHSTACAATRILPINNPGRNRYPLDLFGKEEISPDNYSCFLEPVKLHRESHSCSRSHFLCPIKDEYIPIAMTGFENASSQICHSLKSLKHDKYSEHQQEQSSLPVNLIIVGGSVTWGGYAGGCMEGTCSELKPNGFCATGSGWDCAWVQTIVKYLQHRYKNDHNNNNNPRLKVIDLSWGGTTSCTLLHSLTQRLEARNVNLTSRDILLYDYSVNDGICFPSEAELQRVRQCIEGVLEKLVHYSQAGSPPTVILLEFHPFRLVDVRKKSPDPNSYTRIYHEVARKFHLPIISYRDLFWHPLFRGDLKQYPKLEHILEYKWSEPDRAEEIHPPWIVHDAYADVIAGVLELTHLLCKNRHGVSLKEIDFDPWTDFRRSKSSSGSVVVINEDAATANASYLTPEHVGHLPYGWKLFQDRVGKPGWIIEGNLSSQTPQNSRSLIFSAPLQANFSSSTSPVTATLEITYMQTYKNAGAFRVHICGKLAPTWPEHLDIVDTFIYERFSSLDVAVFKMDLKQSEGCIKKAQLDVKIIHENLGDNLEMRGSQKVKIFSVRLTVSKSATTSTKTKSLPGKMTIDAKQFMGVGVVSAIIVFFAIRIWTNYRSLSFSSSTINNRF